MLNRSFIYKLNEKEYVVNVKANAFQRATYYRYKNGEFFVSTNKLTSNKMIVDGLDKFAVKLIKSFDKRNEKAFSLAERWVYLFGEKVPFPDEINEKNFEMFLKKQLLDYLDNSVRVFEEKMGVKKPYAIRVRKMDTRFGSNSMKTHALSFQLDLVHFSREIIDSVVVHELAHEFQRNHSKKFYDLVYKECPDYWGLKRKLRRRIYK